MRAIAKAKTERDPRLGRWLLAALLFGGLASGALWGGAWLLTPNNVPMQRIRVVGEIRHTRQALLEQTLASRLQGSFFGLELEQVRAAVEALPWVTRASVRRIWPSTLEVWVKEREALARWGKDGVVSPEGVVFMPESGTVPPHLAHLSGPSDSAPEVVDGYNRMRRRLQQPGLGLDIARLQLSERRAWTLDLNNGVRLYLGNIDVDQRLNRFLKQLPGLAQQGEMEHVDARYTNGFAVRWKPRLDTLAMTAGSKG